MDTTTTNCTDARCEGPRAYQGPLIEDQRARASDEGLRPEDHAPTTTEHLPRVAPCKAPQDTTRAGNTTRGHVRRDDARQDTRQRRADAARRAEVLMRRSHKYIQFAPRNIPRHPQTSLRIFKHPVGTTSMLTRQYLRGASTTDAPDSSTSWPLVGPYPHVC